MSDYSPMTVFWALVALGLESSSAGRFREPTDDSGSAILVAADCGVTASEPFSKSIFTALVATILEFEDARSNFPAMFQQTNGRVVVVGCWGLIVVCCVLGQTDRV